MQIKKHNVLKSIILLSTLLWFCVSALGQVSETHMENATDKWVIVFLVGIIQALVGYVYISGLRNITTQIEELKSSYKDLDDKKLDRTLHKQMCPEDKG